MDGPHSEGGPTSPDLVRNIPHMHLFLELKQSFPKLRDENITDCIQRFGLNKDKCEQDLSQKMQEHSHGHYYSHWSQSMSRSSPGSRTSPMSPSAGTPTDNPLVTNAPQTDSEDAFPADDPETAHQPTNVYPQPLYPASDAHIQSVPSVVPVSCSGGGAYSYMPLPDSIKPPPKVDDREQSHASSTVTSVCHPATNTTTSVTSSTTNLTTCSSTFDATPPHPLNREVLQDQLTRKVKLEQELKIRIDEKMNLEEKVHKLAEDIKSRERGQQISVEKNRKIIEDIQRQYLILQSEYNELEREILENGECPRTDEDSMKPAYRKISSPILPSETGLNHFGPPQTHSLPRSNSGSGVANYVPRTPTSPLNIDYISLPRPPPMGTSSRATPTCAQSQSPRRCVVFHGEEAAREWGCSKCTFINHPSLTECEICGFPMFAKASPQPTVRHA